MDEIRTAENRLRNWNGTVHWAVDGHPACGPLATHSTWLTPSVATVNCKRCEAIFGLDTPGHTDPEAAPDPDVARRAAERAERRAKAAS